MLIYNSLIKFNNWIERNKLVAYLLLFLISFLFFSWLQYAPFFTDPDSFYHVRVAQMMASDGILKNFTNLPFTTLADSYIDHHFLYHVYLIPFVTYLPPLVGAKVAHVILDSFLILTFFWLLRRLKVSGAFWYSLFLFFCEVFVFRISLIKAQPFSLIILFIGTYFILTKRYWWLILLSAIYVLFYGGWFLLLFLALIYVAVSAFDATAKEHDRFGEKLFRFLKLKKSGMLVFIRDFFINIPTSSNVSLILSIAFGSFLGIVISPYFPTNLEFYWIQGVQIGLFNFGDKISVGAEWYPYNAWQMIKNASLPLMLVMGSTILFLAHRKKFDLSIKYLFWVMFLFFLATIKARRNIEYLVPFMVIFSAMVFTASFKIAEIKKEFIYVGTLINKNLFFNRWIKWFLVSVVTLALIFLGSNSVIKVRNALSSDGHFNYLSAASNFIDENTNEGEVIFHSDWDDFPPLFYHNNKNHYIIGLDPTFMYLQDKDLYYRWLKLTTDRTFEEIYQVVKNDFGASYVLITVDHKDMLKRFNNNFYFKNVYSDDEVIIFEVL